MPDLAYQTLGVVIALGGAALLYWSLLHDRARGRRRCPKCWYDLRAATTLTCPECGRTAKRERQLFKTRRRWRWVVLLIVVLVGSLAAIAWPKVRRDGVWSVTPSTALILVLPWFEDTSVISEISYRYRNDGELWNWQKEWLVNRLESHVEQYSDHINEIVDLLWYAVGVQEAVRFAFWSIDRPDDQVQWHHLQPLDREEFRQHLNAVIGADRVYRRLVDLVDHSDADVRVQAVRLLSASVETGEYLFPTDQITPVFVRALDDENRLVRSWACSLFYDYQEGPLPSDVVVRLSQWIADDNETASAAIMVFAMSDMPMQDFVIAASQALESTRELTRKNALRALCIRGATSLPVLREALHSEADLQWRKWIQTAITAIENDEPPPRFW